MQPESKYQQLKSLGPQRIHDHDYQGSPMIPMSLISNISNCIVLISTEKWTGTGFLCHLPIQNAISEYYGLMTNNHVLPESELGEYNIINISSDNQIFKHGEGEAEIQILPNRYTFTSKKLDATFILISPSELNTSFDWIEVSRDDEAQKGQSVFMIQHPNGEPQKIAYGIIDEIDGFDINHLVSTEPGSSGSPLLNVDGYAIGLNKAESVVFPYNIATKMFDVVAAIENDILTSYNSNETPFEIESAVENAKKALSKFLNERQSFEIIQINVFFAKPIQICGGSSKSRRAKMEQERDQKEVVVRESEQVYRRSIREIENLAERCKELNLIDFYKKLLFEEAELLTKESENRKRRATDLDNEIRKASRAQFNGGTSSSDRRKIQDLQRIARDEASNLDMRVANILSTISQV